MAHQVYENFVLANEIEDQYNSYLDLIKFCTVDNSLVGVPGMKKMINVYQATDGTEKLAMGEGNTKSIEVSYTQSEYEILLAQNKFQYYDEQEMTDPLVVQTGLKHAAVDMFNTVNADIYAEFEKATLTSNCAALNFDAIVDGVALLNVENVEGLELFGFVNPAGVAALRKNLKETLQYVEAFARQGYIGTVAGVNLYTKKDAKADQITIATKEAVTLFNKKGTEVEQERDGDIRQNTIFSRKYYLAALTDYSKVVKVVKA